MSPRIRHCRPVKETDGPDQKLNPWLAIAQRYEFKPPIDVEERLAAMRYQGAGDHGIHATQVSVSAALLCRGQSIEEVVPTLLEATRAAAGPYAERWNWAREEQAICRMCQDWLAKHPEISERALNKHYSEGTLGGHNGGVSSGSGAVPEANGLSKAAHNKPGSAAKAANGRDAKPIVRKAKRATAPQDVPIIIVKGVSTFIVRVYGA